MDDRTRGEDEKPEGKRTWVEPRVTVLGVEEAGRASRLVSAGGEAGGAKR